jgi:putative membrane protein
MIRILRRCLITAAATTLLVVGGASAADASQGSVGVLSDQDRAFLVGAHQSNLAEIASGKLA